MGFSHKSHDRKSDKETQSPMLRVFKEIIQTEKRDSSKAKLLNDKQEKPKKTRSKSDHKLVDSDSVDRQTYKAKKKMADQADQVDSKWTYIEDQSSIPYQAEKRDSWWLWKEAKKKKTEDSFSCANCPLEKLMGTNYACAGFLIIFAVISVVVVTTTVVRCLPRTLDAKADDDEDLKRTLASSERSVETTERNIWSYDLMNRLGSFGGLFGPAYGDSSLQESSLLNDEGGVSNELASAIDADRLKDMQGSDQLREFYTKLIQADAHIRKLKKSAEDNVNNVFDTDIGYNFNVPDRYKRSVKFTKHKNIANKNSFKQKVANTNNTLIHKIMVTKRMKRNDYEPEGFLVEKNRVLVQYKPVTNNHQQNIKRQFPKCSHIPKESKYHEKHLKHPFYQNSQRLDELLEHVLGNKIPEIMTEPLNLDILFSNKATCSHKSKEKSNVFDAGFNKNTETKELMTHKERNDDILRNIVSDVVSIESQSTQLFDKSTENNNNIQQNILNSLKSETNDTKQTQSNGVTAVFISKSYERTLKPETTNNYFGNAVDDDVSHNINPTLIFKNNKIFNDNNPKGIDENKFGHNTKNNLNMKDQEDNHLLEMGDMSTEKEFNTNVDYNDFLYISTPKIDELRTKVLNQENKNNPIYRDSNDNWRSSSYNRKLLQIEEDEEMKNEYLPKDNLHKTNGENGRKKRYNERNVPDVYNRNWKGPMPLYPDELNAIIKQAAMESVDTHGNTKDVLENEKTSYKLSDTDYIEDYFDSKYDKLVALAQAYSDYGVLESKKQAVSQSSDKPVTKKDKNKFSLTKSKFFNRELFGRARKATVTPTTSEGIRFEYKSGKPTEEDMDVIGSIKKHFQICKAKNLQKSSQNLPIDFDNIINPSSLSYPLDKSVTHKFRTKTIVHHIPNRSLKSVEYVGEDDFQRDEPSLFTEVANDTAINRDSELNSHGTVNMQNMSNALINEGGKNITNNRSNNNTMGVSDFFTMMSDWFTTLAQLSGETNLLGLNNSSTPLTSDVKENKSLDVSYPSYDNDMVDNIGHRSRVLMSIEAKNTSELKFESENFEQDKRYLNNNSNSSINNEIRTDSLNLTTLQLNDNFTKRDTDSKMQYNFKKLNNTNTENKTISKRSVEGHSKLNFWNDIYDDEYGVKSDYFDKPARDKHSIESYNNLVKKSKNWIECKVKKIANRLHSTKVSIMGEVTKIISAEVKKITPSPKIAVRKRRIRNIFSGDSNGANDFAVLTANMKKVIREAVKAVKDTRNLKVREESKEESAASSLMQQLVRLMSDVVDYQVQQKTCAKLPADLQKFLEWLTSSNDKGASVSGSESGFSSDLGYPRFEKSTDNVGLVMPDDALDARSQCLSSIQDVQQLMRQYDGMTEDDKSKMTGVKDYLENQLNFLNSKMNSLDEYNIYKYYKKRETPYRVYREIVRHQPEFKRRRINRIIKKITKKQPRSTLISYDVLGAKKMRESGF